MLNPRRRSSTWPNSFENLFIIVPGELFSKNEIGAPMIPRDIESCNSSLVDTMIRIKVPLDSAQITGVKTDIKIYQFR